MKNLNHYSDESLLKLIANDDEKAFESLFDRYWERAHCLAYAKLKSKEVTQEIVNDLFLNFWERRHSLQINNFSHYLHVSIKNRVITFINKQLLQKKYLEDYRDHAQLEEAETASNIEYNELMKVVEEGVNVLPEKTQQVFQLNRMEGRSVSEIASLLNLSEKAIEYHITQSRKKLRLYLKDFLVLLCVAGCFMLP